MVPERQTEIVQTLEDGREEFLSTLGGLTESEAQSHPQAGRWSVLECVEHVTTVEERFLGRLENAAREGAPPVNPQHEAELATWVKDRTTRAQAPEYVRPSGRFASLTAAVEAFRAARGRTIQFARENTANLYSLSEAHPRFGPLNGIEFLVLMNCHALRHAAQLRELRTDLNK